MPTNLVNHNQVNHYIQKDSRKKEERNKVPRSLFKLKNRREVFKKTLNLPLSTNSLNL